LFAQRKALGVLSDAVLPTSRSDAPSLANLLYQHNVTQQTKRERKSKNSVFKRIQKSSATPILPLILTFNPPQQASERVLLAWAFCASCLSVFCEFWHSMVTIPFRWGTPCLLRGAAYVAVFSGYSFGLLQKSTSPSMRVPQDLNKSYL